MQAKHPEETPDEPPTAPTHLTAACCGDTAHSSIAERMAAASDSGAQRDPFSDRIPKTPPQRAHGKLPGLTHPSEDMGLQRGNWGTGSAERRRPWRETWEEAMSSLHVSNKHLPAIFRSVPVDYCAATTAGDGQVMLNLIFTALDLSRNGNICTRDLRHKFWEPYDLIGIVTGLER